MSKQVRNSLEHIDLINLTVHAVKASGRNLILQEAIALALDQWVTVNVTIYETVDDDAAIWEAYTVHPDQIIQSVEKTYSALGRDESEGQ